MDFSPEDRLSCSSWLRKQLKARCRLMNNGRSNNYERVAHYLAILQSKARGETEQIGLTQM